MGVNKAELEKELVRMRTDLFKRNINIHCIGFAYIVFYPILILMARIDQSVGIRIAESLTGIADEFDEKIAEFNTLVKHYNSLP